MSRISQIYYNKYPIRFNRGCSNSHPTRIHTTHIS